MKHCLVIGYGNTLRRDDGVGVETAQAVADLDLPGINVITRHQLVPELAAPISAAATVIFVDADVTANGQVQLRPLEPTHNGQILAHATDPRSLLALSQQLFGRSPKAWSLGIPVEDLGIGCGLSPRSQRGVREAIQLIRLWAVVGNYSVQCEKVLM